MPSQYLPVAIFAAAAILFVSSMMILSSLIRPHKPSAQKYMSYECGEIPKGHAWIQFNFRFYTFALLFVVFDVEALFIIPWAVRFRQFVADGDGFLVLFEMAVFIAILLLALVYAWRRRALRWL